MDEMNSGGHGGSGLDLEAHRLRGERSVMLDLRLPDAAAIEIRRQAVPVAMWECFWKDKGYPCSAYLVHSGKQRLRHWNSSSRKSGEKLCETTKLVQSASDTQGLSTILDYVFRRQHLYPVIFRECDKPTLQELEEGLRSKRTLFGGYDFGGLIYLWVQPDWLIATLFVPVAEGFDLPKYAACLSQRFGRKVGLYFEDPVTLEDDLLD